MHEKKLEGLTFGEIDKLFIERFPQDKGVTANTLKSAWHREISHNEKCTGVLSEEEKTQALIIRPQFLLKSFYLRIGFIAAQLRVNVGRLNISDDIVHDFLSSQPVTAD